MNSWSARTALLAYVLGGWLLPLAHHHDQGCAHEQLAPTAAHGCDHCDHAQKQTVAAAAAQHIQAIDHASHGDGLCAICSLRAMGKTVARDGQICHRRCAVDSLAISGSQRPWVCQTNAHLSRGPPAYC